MRAWLAAHELPVEKPWAYDETVGQEILAALDAAGALDFTELTIDRVLRWLQALGLWPSDMPASDDLDTLGITVDDLDGQKAEERRRREERARQQRTVHLDDEPFDLGDGLTAFRTALTQSLENTPGFLLTTPQFARLLQISDRAGKSPGSGGGGPGGRWRMSDLSNQQKDAVGFAGEWLAYQWLERRHGTDFVSDCWVSAYREEVFPGRGNDGLGWDFQVPAPKGMYYYEVKTTLGDGGQIELGETQVIAAQEHAKDGRWRLLVVTNVLNEHRRLRMLRNPFDSKSRHRYTFVGQGLRLRYVFD